VVPGVVMISVAVVGLWGSNNINGISTVGPGVVATSMVW